MPSVKHVWLIPTVLFGISLATPAAVMSRIDVHTGWLCLVYGWMSLSGAGLQTLGPGWLANPAIIVGTILLAARKWIPAAILGAIAVLFALSVPFFGDFTKSDQPQPSSGHFSPPIITSLEIGYFFWLGSAAALLNGGWIGGKTSRLPVGPTQPALGKTDE